MFTFKLKSLMFSVKREQFSMCKYSTQCLYKKPLHLICFQDWTCDMVMNVLMSALTLKAKVVDSHCNRFDILKDCKVTMLKEVNEPALNLAVSKAATLLGAYDVTVVDNMLWDNHYNGRIFSSMSDIIFVSSSKHGCIRRFADTSSVPVLCVRSRTHATIQSLSTLMAVIEEFGNIRNLNFAYIGPPHPVLNSYLLLCPMLSYNIRYKCCCQEKIVSPLLMNASNEMVKTSNTVSESCGVVNDVLHNANVIISGPTPKKKESIKEFALTINEISMATSKHWIYFHTFPRGDEVDDTLFESNYARTFSAFENFHYIAAALMALAIKRYRF